MKSKIILSTIVAGVLLASLCYPKPILPEYIKEDVENNLQC